MRIARARRGPARIATAATYIWFYRQVRNRGPWDHKQKQREYADFGNFNYGATGYAAGIPEQTLLRAAGCAQMLVGALLGTAAIRRRSWRPSLDSEGYRACEDARILKSLASVPLFFCSSKRSQ
ncbi:polymorphic toxin type 44 domain-containing protein [Burkholderia dolosa]|uniref:polymorphic toxin type 44 domain-containing protein n=1 Tax=Burkholderia dolosa TaxID=152500 RepID=UPI003D15F827